MSQAGPVVGSEALDDLQRRLRDALDLAVAGGAPLPLLERLGASAALLRALGELPRHALLPEVVARGERALAAWQEWRGQTQPWTAAA